MLTFLRRFLILVIGITLLALPAIVRERNWGYNERTYTPPIVPELNFASTPAPTATPFSVAETMLASDKELRPGPVVVDFAHYSYMNPASLQPLADALAERGRGLHYWLSKVNTMALESSAPFPDQSEDLAIELKDASALIVVSPFFLWTPQEIATAERFVADGGRLLLVSDPDILGDYPSLLNILAEPFGVVFHDDYLYDTQRNDGNFTFFFQEAATNQVEALADAEIVFYGGRSISGAVAVQMRSADTTLSSLRTGQHGFATVAIGGVAERDTEGRVLALSDFDVLSEVYRVRHDNQRMVEFVADFLSGDQRLHTMPDFPSYFGKEVQLAYGARAAINADLLAQGAQLQARLEATGRTLMLTNGHALANPAATGATTNAATAEAKDLIYLADYATAREKTTLLDDLGLQIITEVVTITTPSAVTPIQPPTGEESDVAESENTDGDAEEDADGDAEEDREGDSPREETVPLTRTVPPRVTPTVTATVVPEVTPAVTPAVTPTFPLTRTGDTAATTDPLTATATISTSAMLTTSEIAPRVEITTYLETADGLRLLADETVLVAQIERADGSLLLAVLGANRRGLDAGVARLLANDFSSCVIGSTITYCSLPPATAAPTSSRPTPTPQANRSGTGETSSTDSDDRDDDRDPETPTNERSGILLIDDNRTAEATESSEADLYLQALVADGHDVDLWSIDDQETPTAEDMSGYAWVIWSNGGYADGKLTLEDMDLVFGYVRLGGHLTISSRFPLPGIEEASPLRDVIIDNTVPELVNDLPEEPITLAREQSAANLMPLAADESTVQVALRRGPESEDAEAPVLVILTDTAESELDSRLMLLGMAIEGLPEADGTVLIHNMASWMLDE